MKSYKFTTYNFLNRIIAKLRKTLADLDKSKFLLYATAKVFLHLYSLSWKNFKFSCCDLFLTLSGVKSIPKTLPRSSILFKTLII